MKIGAQLFTLRDFCKTTDDLSETLKKVADIGYTTVQLSGVCDFEASWMAKQLEKNGLTCVVTHTAPDKILADPKKVCDEHKAFGCKNIGIGMMPRGDFSETAYAEFVENFLPVARIFKENGCKLYYHNHAQEFAFRDDGKRIFEHLLEDFSSDLLGIVFDTYWAQFAGADSTEWLDKLNGRLECIHLKDMTFVGKEQHMAPVGFGNMNFPAIIKKAESVGTKYLLVEQDNCYEENPFDCLKKSYAYLSSLGLK